MINVFRLISNEDSIVATISEKNANHKQVIMGADEIAVSIVVPEVLDVKDGDYIYHRGIKYTQNRDVDYTKFSDVNYDYTLLFEHPFYRFLDKIFTFQMTGSAVFTLTGKLVDFVDAVCWNMNYHATNNPRGIDSGWIRGSVVDTDYLTITFSSVSCRDAINQIATAFNAEFFFSGDGKTINFVDHIENETGLIFVQGRGNGLYSVSQQNVDSKDTITRVYPVGGNKNVPNAYADEDGNLKLPELYLQNTTEYNRIVEKRVVFEDVFPHFIGDVESVSGADNIEIVCSDIDFDLNQIAVGDNARINFLTGALMGISFQFQFDFAAKKITLIPQNDDTALVIDDGTIPQVPRSTRKAAVTDKFNFTGVVMPVQYVNAAITKLREKGTSWLSFYSRKRVKFGLEIDYRWMRNKQVLNPGDLVTVQIPERGIDKTIRISELNTRIYDGQLNASVSNYRDENWQKKVEGAISSLQTTVSGGGVGGGVDILERYDARPSSDRNVMSSLRSEKNFLRKDTEDVASERITFDKGAVVRDLATKDFEQGKFLGAGAGIFEDELGNSVIEVDKLHVRKEAWFNEIVINQIRFQGGIVVYSAATLEVLSVTDGGSYLQVYFDTKNGQLANQFAVDDQIRCQRFYGGNVIKYYMSRVTSIGTDFIRLSKTDIDGTLNVEVGDAIVQFGNRTNTGRQSLIEVNVLDGGKQTFYQNVNSYSLTNKNYLELGRVLVDGEWKNMIRSFGGAYVGNRDLSSYIKYNEISGKVEIKASVEFLGTDGSYKSVEQAIDEVEVGGRNLMAGTDLSTIHEVNKVNSEGYADAVFSSVQQLDGLQYTVSFFAESNNATQPFYCFFYNPNNTLLASNSQGGHSTREDGGIIVTANQTKKRYWITWTQSEAVSSKYIVIGRMDGIGHIKISGLKLEKGNKATDWSPAPEDTQKVLDEMSSDNKLTAQEKSVALKEWQAIQGEYTRLSTLATQLGVSNTLSTPYTNLANYINPLLSSMTVTSDIVGSTFRSYFTAYYNASTDLQNALTSKVQSNVSNLKPAGKNYLIGSRMDSLVGWYAYGGTMSVVTDAQYGKVVEYSRPAGGGDFMKVFSIDTSELKNTELVYYCIAKPISGTTIFNFGGWNETFTMLNNNSPYRNLGNGWRMYYKVFTAGSAIASGVTFGLNSVGGTWRFHSFGVAKGNTPPADWDASPKEIDFLKQGYQASTDIEGGVVQTAILLLRNLAEQVTAGMSGLGDDNIGMWAGGTYQEALNSIAKIILRKDGSGQLAGGNITWDAAGALELLGKITAGSGKIGGLDIFSNSLKSASMSFSETPVESLASLITPATVSLGFHYTQDASESNTTAIAYTQNFVIPWDAKIKFRATTGWGVSWPTPEKGKWTVLVKQVGGSTVFSQTGNDAIGNQLFEVSVPAGTYVIEVQSKSVSPIPFGESNTASAYITGESSSTIYAYGYNFQTKIGNNGFYSFWEALKFLYYNPDTGLVVRGATDIPAGLGGASINSSGGMVASSNWGKITGSGQISKSGNNYTITHNIGDTNYSVQIIPGNSTPGTIYYSSKQSNTIVVTCAGAFDFVLIRTK